MLNTRLGLNFRRNEGTTYNVGGNSWSHVFSLEFASVNLLFARGWFDYWLVSAFSFHFFCILPFVFKL